ncbi:DUF1176 domain-containing protein [Brevundimonas sp. NIBR11]|uniref:DUF1176 domain-containing protein n=1 Tax=Brevundimonas sp. NIBR11 TaxID=3015999 RepID=UPI0022F0DCF2|nr:DUF1176 domain-containing protein [Brevundimonas sp. NIBR11]WGM30196.1 hypothetical protein KKHFBJBL_00412 [Brevundimonas sp. NIBR11]
MTMRLIALTAVAALLASCGQGQQAEARAPGAVRAAADTRDSLADQTRFRDWLVSCDNIGTCYAFGPASEGTGWVRITMAAGPDAAPSVDFGFWPDDGAFGGSVTAQVDHAAFEARAETGHEAPPVATVAPDRARALVDAMAQGTAMTLNAGSETVPISLTGAAASLLWIDEHQGRLETDTALIRKGSRPASVVPVAPPAPHIVPAPAVAQGPYGDQEGQTLPAAVEALPAVVQCRAETAFNPDLQAVISSARLDANTVLWSVPCGAGAYNFSNAYFLTTPQGADPRRVLFPSAGDAEPHDLLVNAAYDPATRVIDAFNKGRGLGDCGMADSWTWTGRAFELKSSSAMSECWGVPSEYWPAAWVSE